MDDTVLVIEVDALGRSCVPDIAGVALWTIQPHRKSAELMVLVVGHLGSSARRSPVTTR
jgi:hypothetical protein